MFSRNAGTAGNDRTPSKGLFCGSFLLCGFRVGLCYTVLSVSCSIVITFLGKSWPLGFNVCVMFSCVLSLAYIMVSWDKCGA